MITILHGTDRLTIDERVASMRDAVDPSGISTSVVSDASSDISAVRSACGAVGFFGSGRLVIARDLLTSGPRKGRKSKDDPALESVIEVMLGVPDSTTLVVVEPTLDPKTEREIRKVVPSITIERFVVPRGMRLVDWTCQTSAPPSCRHRTE